MNAEESMKAIWDLLAWPTDDKDYPLRHLPPDEIHQRITKIVMQWKVEQSKREVRELIDETLGRVGEVQNSNVKPG